jgi:hypothetical protein
MIIYKTTNLINNKFYVGKDQHNNPKYLGSGKLLRIAIQKYGKINFEKTILQECKNNDELNKAEIYWINKLKSTDKNIGYNIAKGGMGGKTLPEPWNKGKKLPSLTKKQKDTLSKKLKQYYKLNKHPTTGMSPWNKNKKLPSLSNEQKQKMSKSLKGHFVSEYTKQRVSETMKGKPKSLEQKQKIREKLLGKKLPETTRKNMSNARKGDSSCAGPIIKCPYCNKIGTNNAMRRWHFENCNKKEIK